MRARGMVLVFVSVLVLLWGHVCGQDPNVDNEGPDDTQGPREAGINSREELRRLLKGEMDAKGYLWFEETRPRGFFWIAAEVRRAVVKAARQEFLELPRPVEARTEAMGKRIESAIVGFRLEGEWRDFAEKYPKHVLVDAVRDLAADERHRSDVLLLLAGTAPAGMHIFPFLEYVRVRDVEKAEKDVLEVMAEQKGWFAETNPYLWTWRRERYVRLIGRTRKQKIWRVPTWRENGIIEHFRTRRFEDRSGSPCVEACVYNNRPASLKGPAIADESIPAWLWACLDYADTDVPMTLFADVLRKRHEELGKNDLQWMPYITPLMQVCGVEVRGEEKERRYVLSEGGKEMLEYFAMYPSVESLRALLAMWRDEDLDGAEKEYIVERIVRENENGKPSAALKKRSATWRELIARHAGELDIAAEFLAAAGVEADQ